jgi:serine/threonine-protein kinase
MAPEQARGGTVDYRTDLYALAAVAYRALTGQPPFGSGEVAETLYRVVHTAPTRPSKLAKLPDDLDLVLAIALAKLPGLRFGSAGELSTALAQAFDGTLSNAVRERGRVLVRGGAWAPEVTAT